MTKERETELLADITRLLVLKDESLELLEIIKRDAIYSNDLRGKIDHAIAVLKRYSLASNP
jgi:hypothetical protein